MIQTLASSFPFSVMHYDLVSDRTTTEFSCIPSRSQVLALDLGRRRLELVFAANPPGHQIHPKPMRAWGTRSQSFAQEREHMT